MAFTPDFLDEIRARLSVSDVVGRRVRLTKAGREHKGLCPFHNEKTPSFYVNDDKGFFHCFGCGAHGDVFGFTMRAEGLEFREAVERMAGLAGLQLPVESPAERERAEQRKTLHQVVEAACAWFEAQLRAPGGRAALAYLRDRGLDDATIKAFRLGFAPDGRTALKDALKAQGIDESQALEAGLLVKPEGGGESYDFFRGRVMFAINDRRGQVVAFGGRVMGDGQPKYLNSRDTPLFDKGRMLYALDKAREGVRGGAELIVVEGYMDVIALHAAGFSGAVAPLGTAFTEAQIEQLWKLAPEPIVCFDGDAAGQRAALRAADRALPILAPGLSLRFAVMPLGDDPDSLVRKRGPEALRDVLRHAKPLSDVVWESEVVGRVLETPEQRAALRQSLFQRAAAIADKTVQTQYRQMLFERFDKRFGFQRRWSEGYYSKPSGRGSKKGVGGEAGLEWGASPSNNVEAIRSRAFEALIAAFINHPRLLHEELEALARIELPVGELDRIRKEILNVAAQDSDLDSTSLENHLKATGLSEALERLLRRSLYDHWSCVAPEADRAEARTIVRAIVLGWEGLALLAEVSAEEANLPLDLPEEEWAAYWNRLRLKRRQALEMGDEDGEAAGAFGPP